MIGSGVSLYFGVIILLFFLHHTPADLGLTVKEISKAAELIDPEYNEVK